MTARPFSIAAALWLTASTPLPAAGQLAPAPREEPPAEAPEIAPPRLLAFAEAAYPPEALAAGREAEVRLALEIDETGAVAFAEVLEPVGDGFDAAALEAAYRFAFAPATADGEPIAVRIEYVYRFELAAAPPGETEVAPPPTLPAPVTIRGQVLERGTPRAVQGGVVTVVDTGDAVATDDEGRFELRGAGPGPVALVATGPGHEPLEATVEVVEGEVATPTLRLRVDPFADFRTVVRGEVPRAEPTRNELDVQEVNRIPGVSGDALKAVQNLTGVARTPAFSGLLVVRGSDPEDTIYKLDGLALPQLFHFFGLYSVIPTDLLASIDFAPGGFSTRYGDGTSGLVEAHLKPGRTDTWGGHFDINVFHAAGLAEGPIGDGGSIAIAARRSYIDAILPQVVPSDVLSFSTAPVYYDGQIKLDLPLSPRTDLRLFTYGSFDELKLFLADPADTDPAVRGAVSNRTWFIQQQIRVAHRYRDGARITAAVQAGYEELKLNVGPSIDFLIQAPQWTGRLDASIPLGSRVTLDAGLDYEVIFADVDITAPLPPKEGAPPSAIATQEILQTREKGTYVRPSVYLEATARPIDALLLTAGVRADFHIGDYRAITADPRVGWRWTIADGTVLKGGVGLYHRRPVFDELSRTYGNPDLEPERALQVSLGVEQRIWGGLSVDVQAFYKHQTRLIRRYAAPETERGFAMDNSGLGRVYGAEILLRQEFDRYVWGWIAYSLSRAERKDGPDGGWRVFDFDQTHVLTAVIAGRLPLDFEIGARFRYTTGNPQTPYEGAVLDTDSGVYAGVLGAVNSIRAPAFHQLDVRLDKRWVFDTWTLVTYLEVQNVYNRMNPEGFRYSFDYKERAVLSGLPIIPGFGVKGEF